ncbi:MAG: nucleoid-associated protein [Bacillota bacterium]
MRNIEAVVVKKSIIHVLDKNTDAPILTDFEQEIDEDIHEFLEKHIIKSLADEENRKGKFRTGSTAVKDACQRILEDENNFVDASKEIAIQLFKAMKNHNNISSSDLVVCLYTAEDKDYIGILKLDYKKSFIHNIEFFEDRFKITIMPQAIGLPGMGQRLQKCAFIKPYESDDEFDLILLDKQGFGKEEDTEIAEFFAHHFLNCEVLVDNRDKTKLFRLAAEKWTRKNLKDDIEKAQEIREEVISCLRNDIELDIEKFSQQVLGNDASLQTNFMQHLDKEGLTVESFDIDKTWVDRKIKKRVLKTDTGIEIKGMIEDMEDDSKIEVKRNGDGTVNIIIKSVRHFAERS